MGGRGKLRSIGCSATERRGGRVIYHATRGVSGKADRGRRDEDRIKVGIRAGEGERWKKID